MSKFKFLSFIFLLATFACNNSSDHNGNADTVKPISALDTNTKHQRDTVKVIAPLPAVPIRAKVYFANLKNGQTVRSPFEVRMGIKGLKIAPAGSVLPDAGHHHLLIDAGDSVASGQVIPKDDHHLHFGDGQTMTQLTLLPGKHRLALQFADGLHRSYGRKLASAINIVVK